MRRVAPGVGCDLEGFRRLNLCAGAGARAWTRRGFRLFARRVHSPTLSGNCAARRLALPSFGCELGGPCKGAVPGEKMMLNRHENLWLTVGERRA